MLDKGLRLVPLLVWVKANWRLLVVEVCGVGGGRLRLKVYFVLKQMAKNSSNDKYLI